MENKFWKNLKSFFIVNRLSLYTIFGVVFGLLAGLATRQWLYSNNGIHSDIQSTQLMRYLSLPGLIYIRLFMMLIVPLLITSLVTSFISHSEPVNDNDTEDVQTQTNRTSSSSPSPLFDSNSIIQFEYLIVITLSFFVGFSLFASVFGITLVSILKPGVVVEQQQQQFINITTATVNHQNNQTKWINIGGKDYTPLQASIVQRNYQTDSLYNIFLNIFPDNLFTPMFISFYTKTDVQWPQDLSQLDSAAFKPQLVTVTSHSYKPNMLGICVLSLVFGYVVQKVGPQRTKLIRRLLHEVDSVVKCIMQMLINVMPYGMFCWMFTEGLRMHSISQVAGQLGHFFAIAIGAFLVLWLVFYPGVYLLLTGHSPFRLYSRIVSAMLVALGSSSSAITLPVTMRCMEEKVGLCRPVSRVVLPLGMTIHMNGSALYYPMVAVFVAQMKQVPLDWFTLAVLSLFAVVMSMGMPGLPAGGTVVVNHLAFASVLGVENPEDVLAFILAFEWIMERLRTMTNVIGDCITSHCIERVVLKKKKAPIPKDLTHPPEPNITLHCL